MMHLNVPSTRSRLVLSAIVCALLIAAAPAAAQSYTVLYAFDGSDGYFPHAGLMQGSDGNFYGTTAGWGGYSPAGTVFKITPGGTLTTLHSFSISANTGFTPWAGLVQGGDGNFYGTTSTGGTSGFYGWGGYGTVFKITPAGTLTTLYSFSNFGSDGQTPYAGLVQGSDGNFYGATSSGGTGDRGTVFKITPGGTLTTLHSFSFSGSEGDYPYTLVQGSDGNFYGATSKGGTSNFGTVFKITPGGTLTTLHSFSFSGSDGQYPYAGLVQGSDGNFYGTTHNGGTGNVGTVFKITPAGTLTTLYSFSGSDGSYPQATLVQGSDGTFYGTTDQGGTGGGTVFKITPAGTLTTLHLFAGSDGQNPEAGLVQGTDGYFYGTTYQGGTSGGGVVFRLTMPSPTVTGVSPASGPASGGTVVTVSGTEFQPGATVSFGGTAATGITYVSATTINAVTPVHAAGAVTVTVTNPDLQAGSLASAYTYTCSWTPTASNTGPYCTGGTISLSTPTVSGATYSWTGPNGFTSAVQNPTISNATAANAGTYSITVTAAGCTSAAGNTTVVVNPVPATPVITAPASVSSGATEQTASVPAHAGSTYAWGITNGTIAGGQGTNQITFTGGTAGTPLTLSVTETTASGCVSAAGTKTITVAPAGPTGFFYTVTPCRQLDTRSGSGSPISPGGTLAVALTGAPCGIPSSATSVSVNAVVTQETAMGHLTIYPADKTQPLASTINFNAGQTRANNAILPLSSDGTGRVNVVNGSGGTTHVVIDVNGYFQ
jgi:uncharacterized repeat protein (TIGR03803 family)